MKTNSNCLSISRLSVSAIICLIVVSIGHSQQPPSPKRYIPPEFQASDQEIRKLLTTAELESEAGEYESAFADFKAALELSQKKGLVGDRAIAEESVASGYFSLGKVDESIKLYQASLQHATESSNLVLQADVLVALSTVPQFQGDSSEALDLLSKALDRANQTMNQYIRSRVLGELGRFQIASGQIAQGRKSLAEALNIDKVNHYNFEALHLVYSSYAILSDPQPDLILAISQLESARDLAVEKDNYFAFVQAQNALGGIYVHNGEVSKGISTLEATQKGSVQKDGKVIQLPQAFLKAANLPVMKATILEALAQGYENAQQSDQALQAWNQLYLLSIDSEFNLTMAESSSKIANLYSRKKDIPSALNYYEIAIQNWRVLKNPQQLSRNLFSEGLLLIQSGKGEAAIPLIIEVADIAERTNNRSTLFTAYGVLGEIYQPIGKFQEARMALEKATALIQPDSAEPEFDPKAVLEDYIFLGNDYRALQLPIQELVVLEREVAVLQTNKDGEALQQALSYLNGRIQTLQVADLAAADAHAGRLSDSLWYSEILYFWNGVPKDGTTDENWNRVLNLPFQVIQRPDGPHLLDQILSAMGPMLKIAKLPILDALASHYLTVELKPGLAEQYATEAINVTKQGGNPSASLLLRPTCYLSLAYARQGKLDLADHEVNECLALAETTDDVQSKTTANATNALVRLATNDLGAAEESLKYLLANIPEDPEVHLELAFALVSKGLSDQGVAEFNQAINLLERKKDLNGQALAFVRMASAFGPNPSKFGKQQLDYLRSSEHYYKEANNAAGTAAVDIEIGIYYQNAGDNKAALPYFQHAEVLGQGANDSQISARAALLVGNTYNLLKDYGNAVTFHRRASAVYHEISDGNLEALALLLVGQDLQSQKDFDSALKVCLEAENIALRSSTPITSYAIQITLEQFYYQEGEFDKALTSAQNEVHFATAGGDKQRTAQAYIVLAGICEILGQWEDAVTASNKALEIFKSLSNTQGTISSYAELASIYGDRSSSFRNFDKAMEYYREATKLGANLQYDLVEIYSQNGRLSEGIAAAKTAIQECIKNHNVECQAGGLDDLAEIELKNGDLAAAASSLKAARRLAPGIKDVYFQGSLLYREAGQQRAEGHLEQALKTYQELISLIERVKGQGDVKSQLSLSETYGYIYDELCSTLYAMSAGKLDPDRSRLALSALQYAETNKAREFARTWGRSFIAELRRTMPGDLQERERTLIDKSDHLRATVEGEKSKPSIDSIDKEMASFIDSLRLTHPQYAAVAYPQLVTLESIPLRKGETLVEFKVTDESTLVWIIRNVTGNKVELVDFYQAPKPRQWFEERVLKLRIALNSGQLERIENIDWHNSEELFNELFPGSLSKTVLESNSIIFVPDDVLSVIPLELLSPDASRENFPLLSVPTTYYPSAASLQLSRAAKHFESWQEAFLGIGDPITSDKDERYAVASVQSAKHVVPAESAVNQTGSEPRAIDLEKMASRGLPTERLPETAKEVNGIAMLFQNQGQAVEVRLGSDATKTRLTSTDLTRFRYLHFATHGLLPADSNIPEPALLLSFDGSGPEHMLLSMSEILGLKIHAETVVLSACNTGSGKVMHAEGVMSLGRAFMAAGAESVTVSLWEVEDTSTQMLMEEYYKNLIGGKSKAEALSIARSSLFAEGNSFKNPYFWAPFVLIGD